MGHARVWILGAGLGLVLSVGACPGETEIAKDPASGGGASNRGTGDDGSSNSDSGAGQIETPAVRGGSGGSGGASGGRAGSSGSGTSGSGTADAGADAAGAGAGAGSGGAAGQAGTGGTVLGKCLISGCSNTICADAAVGPQITTCEWREEYACYEKATCERQSDGECGWTQTPELQTCLGGSVDLQWFTSCGTPVCTADTEPFDSASIDNCTSEKVGDACSEEGARCDGVATCGATLICATSDPQAGAGGCPRSRARYKEEIHYLDGQALARYHEQVVRMPLASYRYKQSAEGSDQLGFIIEDIEPSAAVSGDRVNLYGYLSMAVAAIKVQQQQIDTLERELAELKETRPQDPSAAVCAP